MSSPILEYIYQNTGVDPAYLLLIVAVLLIILIILTIIVLCKLKKLYRTYDRFMRGKDAESLEDTLLSCISKTNEVEEVNKKLQEDVAALYSNQRMTYQKMGMVKYDAFREMSGKLSFALVLLDQQNNGFILNSVYLKEGGYSYIKRVVKGECDILLSEEEQKALEKAKALA